MNTIVNCFNADKNIIIKTFFVSMFIVNFAFKCNTQDKNSHHEASLKKEGIIEADNLTPKEVIQDTPRACIVSRYDNNEDYIVFYNENGKVVKSITEQKFAESIPSRYSPDVFRKKGLTPAKSGDFYYLIDSINLHDKKILINDFLYEPKILSIDVIKKIHTIVAYNKPILSIFDKYLVYGKSIWFVDDSDWGPVLSETHYVVFDFHGEKIGEINTGKIIEKPVLSEDGKYLLGEVVGFSPGEGGDSGIEGYNLYEVTTGRLLYHIPYFQKHANSDNIEYGNGMFKITFRNWMPDGKAWHFCIDPLKRVFYKRSYSKDGIEWKDKEFMRFKSKINPNGFQENLSEYEKIVF